MLSTTCAEKNTKIQRFLAAISVHSVIVLKSDEGKGRGGESHLGGNFGGI